jgi:hypothetical protein
MMEIELKFENSRSGFEFRKLNKIVGSGLKT